MIFLSSTAFILMWFNISIFIFLKFILGEPIKLQNTDSLDDIVGNGIYDIELSLGNPFGKSSDAIMIVSKVKAPSYNGLIMQRAYRNNIYKMRWKWTSGWTSWHDIGIDIPSFYKDYSTLASLVDSVFNADSMGFSFNDSNIDSMTRRGIYHVSGYSGSHFPTNAFGLLLFFGDEYKVQIFLDMYQNIIHYRRNVGDGWSVWYDVSATAQ